MDSVVAEPTVRKEIMLAGCWRSQSPLVSPPVRSSTACRKVALKIQITRFARYLPEKQGMA